MTHATAKVLKPYVDALAEGKEVEIRYADYSHPECVGWGAHAGFRSFLAGMEYQRINPRKS